jgi:hypothetical protein
MRRPYWRKTTWIVLLWTVVFVAVAVAIALNSDKTDLHTCLSDGRSMAECKQVVHGADAIGAAIIVFIGVLGLVPLSLIWLLTGVRRRDCGSCGAPVRRWRRRCPNCGYDMRRRPAPPVATGGEPAVAAPPLSNL